NNQERLGRRRRFRDGHGVDAAQLLLQVFRSDLIQRTRWHFGPGNAQFLRLGKDFLAFDSKLLRDVVNTNGHKCFFPPGCFAWSSCAQPADIGMAEAIIKLLMFDPLRRLSHCGGRLRPGPLRWWRPPAPRFPGFPPDHWLPPEANFRDSKSRGAPARRPVAA